MQPSLYFYPRPPRGGRLNYPNCRATGSKFLSTPSARRATGFGAQTPSGGYDFYPRPPRGGRPAISMLIVAISIFLSTPSARRATADRTFKWMAQEMISIHALREEGDKAELSESYTAKVFLSTPSARRATSAQMVDEMLVQFLSTPSARRATEDLLQRGRVRRISIHALREEGDGSPCRKT